MADWTTMENKIAKFQSLQSIHPEEMFWMIKNYRRTPRDNVFDIVITSSSSAVSQTMSMLNKVSRPTKFEKVNSYTMKMVYEDVGLITNQKIRATIQDKIKNVKMRGSTFFIILF